MVNSTACLDRPISLVCKASFYQNSMSYTTYIFDFDYTLADSSRGIVMCYRHVLTREGFLEVTDEQIKRTIGKTLEDSFSEMTGITDVQRLASMKQQYVEHANSCMTANTHLFPETKEVLSRLKQQGARIAILSTKYRYRIEELAARDFPAGFFDLIVGGEDVRQMKPSPEGLLLAMERLQATPAETLYLGDSVVDALTAQAAGVPFAGVLHGVTTREELAAYPHIAIYDNLHALLSAASLPGVQAPPWVAWWKLPILYFMGSMAWDELVEASGFPLFLFLFLLTLWWTLQGRRFLPLPIHRWMMQQLQPLNRRLRGFFLRVKRGRTIPTNTMSTTVCKCCGEIYQGNFCPRCGQAATTSRYRMSNALKNIAGGFFNIDSGFGRTLIDLFYRPGHLIREFVTGRRAFYFRPFQMLFILAAIYIMIVQLVDPDALRKAQDDEYKAKVVQEQLAEVRRSIQEKNSSDQERVVNLLTQVVDTLDAAVAAESADVPALSDEQEKAAMEEELQDEQEDDGGFFLVFIKKISALFAGGQSMSKRLNQFVESHPFVQRVVNLMEGWIHGNKAFSVLVTLPLFALASRFVFRKPKYRPQFNMTEHLFVQAFIACQLLLLSMVLLFVHGHAEVDDFYDVSASGIFFIFCFVYKQLYCLSWWESFVRTFKMFVIALLLLILLAILVLIVGGGMLLI